MCWLPSQLALSLSASVMLTHQVSQSGHMTPFWSYLVYTALSQPRQKKGTLTCIMHRASLQQLGLHYTPFCSSFPGHVHSSGFLCLQETKHPQMSTLFDYLTIFMHDTYLYGSICTISLYQNTYNVYIYTQIYIPRLHLVCMQRPQTYRMPGCTCKHAFPH